MRSTARLAVAVTFFYALGYPLGGLALQAMSPGPVLVLRFAISAPLLVLLASRRRVRWPRGRLLLHVIVAGLLLQAVQFIAGYAAMGAGLSPVLLALTISMNPLATALLAKVLLGEAISQRKVIALVLAVVAVVVAFAGRLVDAGTIGWGVVGALIALLGVSLGGVHQQRHVHGVDPVAMNAIGIAASVPPAVVFALCTPWQVHHAHQAVVTMTAMVLLSSVVAMSLYVEAVGRLGAAQVAMLFAVIPSGAALLGWVLLGQRPDVGVVLGLLIGAVATVVGRERAPHPRRAREVTGRRIAA